MAPKQKISREQLLENAFMIAEKHGIEAVTSRTVAAASDCSIQPVFSHFPTMEELRQAVFDYACDKFVAEILAFEGMPDFLPRTTKWMLDLARYRPNLFTMLYLSKGFKENKLLDIMMSYKSNERMTAKMAELYGLDETACYDILMRSFLLLMGISSMICVNGTDISDSEAADMMKRTVADMVQGVKRGNP